MARVRDRVSVRVMVRFRVRFRFIVSFRVRFKFWFGGKGHVRVSVRFGTGLVSGLGSGS